MRTSLSLLALGVLLLASSACSRGREQRPYSGRADEVSARSGGHAQETDNFRGEKMQARGEGVPGNSRKEGSSSAGEAEIVKQTNLSFGTGSERVLDVYFPAEARGAPVVFMVHGGAWRLGDKGAGPVVTNKMRHFTARGFVFVSTNYRLSGVSPLDQAKDVAQAIAYVQKNAESLRADPQRIVLVGHSSGAHLVSLLAADPSYSAEAGLRPWLGTIALDSAAYDVTSIMRRRHFPFYDRAFGTDERLWARASPLLLLRSAPAPFLAVCSSLRTDSCPQARAFVEKATSLGGQAKLAVVSKSHQEINADLGTPDAYTASVDAFLASLGL